MPIKVTSRITSEKIRIDFLPGSLVEATHIQHIYFDSANDGGTFKLWVNGETTAAITFSATPATLVSNINTALDALANLTAGDIVASGSVITDITLTASGAGNKFFRILPHPDNETTITQGTPNNNPKEVHDVTTQGSSWITLSAQASSFSWERSLETVDVTAISEFDRLEIGVAEAVSFDISLYKLEAGSEDWVYAIYGGNNGLLWVFPEGKVVGKEHFQFQALIESVGEDYPDHEKVEIEISGMRQGAFTEQPNSIYRG
jgi:hypothetical protein